MLKSLFEWFDGHAGSYWMIAWIPTLLLLAVAATGQGEKSKRGKRAEIFFAFLVFVVLLAWRWPFLLSADEYNPDESQLIAGAITLPVDLVPWRSLDGFTSGPLNFYPLLLPRLLGLPLDYFTARVVALLLIWAALLACYRLFRSWSGPELARLGILPALAFFCTVTDTDFIHYSSEHLSLFLLALSAYGILGASRAPLDPERRQRIACFIAGLLPWAKLQSAPLAATLVGFSLWRAWCDRDAPASARVRNMGMRVLCAAIPTLVVLAVVVLSGQTPHFLRSYILQNFNYVSSGETVSGTVRGLWNTSRMTNHFPVFLTLSLLVILATELGQRANARKIWVRWAGCALFLVSTFCILTPRRALLHYVLLSIIPLAIWFGLSLGAWSPAVQKRHRIWLGLGASLMGLIPFGVRATQPVPAMFGSFAEHWRQPRTEVAKLIRAYALPGSRLAIWGWLPSLFVETGLPQGTRDGNTAWAMMPSSLRDYYMQRFLSDLQRNAPDFFVDAVGFGSRFFPDRMQAGHESFPALAEYVRTHYQLLTDEGYARVYAKPDLISRHVQRPAIASARLPATDVPETMEGMHRESITPPDLPQWKTRSGYVQMMHPPAQIVWALDPNTREVIFDYGFAPEAYRNNRSDGAELIFELHSEGVPVRHLFYKLLDPVHRAEDRGPNTVHLILPPFKAGARLIARTTVGPFNNGAWDWIYLGHVVPVIAPKYSPAQFPHFNRPPDFADADLSYFLREEDDQILVLHAPALIRYRLTGQERRLRFDYGFRTGAYSNGGQTDGAIFNVELQAKEADPPSNVWRSALTPTGKPEDRGLHHADLTLPVVREGDLLTIRIDPGAGGAWDWTYLTHFILE